MAMLEIKDLQVCYGVINAIKGVSFEVNERDNRSDRRKRRGQDHYTAHYNRTCSRKKRLDNV